MKYMFFFNLLPLVYVVANQVSASDDDARKLFEEFKIKYGKNKQRAYDNEKRFTIFKSNLEVAQKLQRTEMGTAEYGVTQFSDLTDDEFVRLYATARMNSTVARNPLPHIRSSNIAIPVNFDWRNLSVVTPVKNQGQCGSCYAFAVTANVESAWAIKNGILEDLSEQQIVDCTGSGCNGGYMHDTFWYVIKTGGLMREVDYPYVTSMTQCEFSRSKTVATLSSYYYLPRNEAEQPTYLYHYGPFTITYKSALLKNYRGGIIDQRECPGEVNHASLTVGYGVYRRPGSTNLPYWIVKNSWGADFGEQGYFRIVRGKNLCQVADYAIGGLNRGFTSHSPIKLLMMFPFVGVFWRVD